MDVAAARLDAPGGTDAPSAPFPLAGLLPRQETQAAAFLRKHPEYDGRGIVVAVLDTGVDPAAAGLQVTSTGAPKVIDVVDCSGAGDVDTTTVVTVENGEVKGMSGRVLRLNAAWTNPLGQVRLGIKRAYELLPKPLVQRLQDQRRAEWDRQQHHHTTEAQRLLAAFEAEHPKGSLSPEDKRLRGELDERVKQLNDLQSKYDDPGPIYDVIVFHDGTVWRAAVDVSQTGDLTAAAAMTDFHVERQHAMLSKDDMMSYAVNIYEEGAVCSIVTTCGSHGTHVAGIVGAHFHDQPELSGVAPGCQVVSLKIGDNRLGTMETGTALVRALIATSRSKCDLINLSYGEAALLSNSGRLVPLINELVDQQGVIFVTSAGNDGPALSSVGAPASTTSHVIGVGAYVSPALMQAAHSLLDRLPETQYTWTSRGPCLDGARGVSVCAPGGAIAPVPTWTLQKAQLMEGTSMASPNCCGSIALLLSALRAQGVEYSPYRIQRALENTARPVRAGDPFAYGAGLIQVDGAYEHLLRHAGDKQEDVRFEITFPNSPSPMRGVYLRRAAEVSHVTQTNVHITPVFRKKDGQASYHNEDRLAFELRAALVATAEWVACPEHIELLHGGRGFNIRVDPTVLPPGAHYAEIHGVDIRAPQRGPVFRIPVTVVKGENVPLPSPLGRPGIMKGTIRTKPGDLQRFFWNVPHGATWATLSLQGHHDDRPRVYMVHVVQPQLHATHKQGAMKMTVPLANEIKEKGFPLVGGTTLELAIAHYWSSLGAGELSFELRFHGLEPQNKRIVLSATEGAASVDVQAYIRDEELVPTATLTTLRQSIRPSESLLRPLYAQLRDQLWDGRQIFERVFEYKFKLSDGLAAATITPVFPLLNNLLYESEYESQLWLLFDTNKKLLASGDVFPHALPKLANGSYVLRLQVRHDNVDLLNKIEKMMLQLDCKMKDDVKLDIFSDVNSARTEKGKFGKRTLSRGEPCVLFINPPAASKLPKDAKPGDVFAGTLKLGKTVAREYEVVFVVPPEVSDKKEKDSASDMDDEKVLADKFRCDQRDLKIKWLTAWRDKGKIDEYNALLQDLETTCAGDIVFLSAKLTLADTTKERSVDDVIHAADAVRDAVDVNALAAYFGLKHKNLDDPADERLKKEMEGRKAALVDALYKKGLALSEKMQATSDATEAGEIKPALVATYQLLESLVDTADVKYLPMRIAWEMHNDRLAAALKFIQKYLSEGEPTAAEQKTQLELRRRLLARLGWDHWDGYEAAWNVLRFPKVYARF